MLKKSLKTLCVAVLLLWVGGAQAEPVRIWQEAANGGYQTFEAVMKENGSLSEKGIKSEALGLVAFQYAKDRGHLALVPEQYRSPKAYTELFLQRNGVRTPVLSAEQFRAKGKNDGWWLPTETDATAASLSTLAGQLYAMKQQVETLEKSGQSVAVLKSELTAFERRIDAVNTESVQAQKAVKELKGGLQALRNGGLTNKMVKQVDEKVAGAVQGLNDRVNDTDRRVAEFGANVMAVQGQIELIDKAVIDVEDGRDLMLYLSIAALGLGVGLVVWQLLLRSAQRKKDNGFAVAVNHQAKRTTDLEQAVYGLPGDEKAGLQWSVSGLIRRQEEVDEELAQHKAELESLKGEVKTTLYGQSRLVKQVREIRHEVEDLQSLSEAAGVVEFDPANPGLEVLEQLSEGEESGVTWKGRYNNGHFTVKIWKDETTLPGMVKTNVVRSTDSGQLAEPMALKRLKKRVEAAVIDGRVPTVKLLSDSAAA